MYGMKRKKKKKEKKEKKEKKKKYEKVFAINWILFFAGQCLDA